jgi:uncharacterized protein (TIGR03437 family)
MKKWIVWSVLFICCTTAHSAQAPVPTAFSGRVVTLAGEGLPGVSVGQTITCTGVNPGSPPMVCSGSAQSDDNGFYQFSIPPCPVGSPSCFFPQSFFSISKPGYSFSGPLTRIDPNTGNRRSEYVGIEGTPFVSTSAASYRPTRLSAGMIATIFGAELATTTTAATTLPLPTELAGRSVFVRGGSDGREVAAPLLFVSPTQINYIVPEELAGQGPMVIKVTEGMRPVGGGFAILERIAPGIFTANADSRGVAAAVVYCVKPDGSASYEPVSQFDAARNQFVFAPIDFGPEGDQLLLVLFGTGWRNRVSLSDVTVSVGGTSAPVEYAGLQTTIPGLDQINARLPRSLAGRGETTVVVRVETQQANTATISFK